MALRSRKIAKTIDVRGKVCPYPVLETKQALQNMPVGQILEVITDLKDSTITLPNFCQKRKMRYELLEIEPDKIWKFLIKKS